VNVIEISVKNRAISYSGEFLPLVSKMAGRDFVAFTLDDEWSGLDKRVTFTGGGVDVTVPFADTLEIPHEVISCGSLLVSVVGIDQSGEEILRTKEMRPGLTVFERGADMGSEAAPRTMDVAALAEQRLGELEAAIPAVEEDWESVKAEQASEFTSAQSARSETFATDLAEWNRNNQRAAAVAREAAADAVESATAAQNVADAISQMAQSGAFDGRGFEGFKFSFPSVAEMNAAGYVGQQKFDMAIINSDPDDPDNSSFFMWTGSEWHYVNDLSGGQGLPGPQGPQGVSLHRVRVINQTQVEVTQYDPMTKQETTYVIGDFAAPLAAGIKAYVDSKFVVVDAMPDNPVDGLLYFVRE